MNSASDVSQLITELKSQGLTKAKIVIRTAEACLGWPYVWGGYGQLDTPANRKSYADRSSCPAAEANLIISRCQVLNGKKNSCSGCKFFPKANVRFFDCRGFTRWCLQQVGITISGAGATTQYNTAANWTERGEIKDMPQDTVCCVFQQSAGRMQHTGLYVGNGRIIHCSGTVKVGKTTDKGWTHYAVPKGIEGEMPVPDQRPTLRKGSRGEYVTLLQTKLIQQGYDVGQTGADGVFGDKTRQAVMEFQRDHNLVADGVVGTKTWDALEEGHKQLWTVTISHVSRTVADSIVTKYGGTMTAEGE